MGKQRGFSLIELLIVVAVILIIAAIAIPSFLQARMSANGASAVDSLRNIDTAEVSYASTYPTLGFAPDLNTLGPGGTAGGTASSANAMLLDDVLGCPTGVGTASCQKSGYNFNITAGTQTPISTYTANANPIALDTTGTRYFFTDNSAVIRSNSTTIATAFDLHIQ